MLLQFEIGARYNRATVDQDLLTTLTYAGFPLGATPGPATLPDDNKVTGRIGLSYQIDPKHFLYGFVATGHKNPGLNTSIYSPPAFDGEDVTDVEFGYIGGALWLTIVIVTLLPLGSDREHHSRHRRASPTSGRVVDRRSYLPSK